MKKIILFVIIFVMLILSSCDTTEQRLNDGKIGIIIIGQIASDSNINLNSIRLEANFSRTNKCDNHNSSDFGTQTDSTGRFIFRISDFGVPYYSCIKIIVSPDTSFLFYPDTLFYPNTYLNRINSMDTLNITIELNGM